MNGTCAGVVDAVRLCVTASLVCWNLGLVPWTGIQPATFGGLGPCYVAPSEGIGGWCPASCVHRYGAGKTEVQDCNNSMGGMWGGSISLTISRFPSAARGVGNWVRSPAAEQFSLIGTG